MRRGLRIAFLTLGALGLLALLAVGLSAVLDRPAKVVTMSATVPGPKQEVWETLTDFGAYREWNPVVTHAEGQAREGAELDLDVVLPGHDPESLDAEVVIARPKRKVRWQDRLLLPGIRDLEYEFVLQPLDDGRVLVVQQLRIEGLLAPFADKDAAQEALALTAEALEQRLAGR
ncbi:MAG: SRPBCC family protein [Gaiellaceae bacterium]